MKDEEASKAGRIVGWFVKGENQLITIRTEKGQTAEEAIAEEAKDHGVKIEDVMHGEPPDDFLSAWISHQKSKSNMAPDEASEKKTTPPSSGIPAAIQVDETPAAKTPERSEEIVREQIDRAGSLRPTEISMADVKHERERAQMASPVAPVKDEGSKKDKPIGKSSTIQNIISAVKPDPAKEIRELREAGEEVAKTVQSVGKGAEKLYKWWDPLGQPGRVAKAIDETVKAIGPKVASGVKASKKIFDYIKKGTEPAVAAGKAVAKDTAGKIKLASDAGATITKALATGAAIYAGMKMADEGSKMQERTSSSLNKLQQEEDQAKGIVEQANKGATDVPMVDTRTVADQPTDTKIKAEELPVSAPSAMDPRTDTVPEGMDSLEPMAPPEPSADTPSSNGKSWGQRAEDMLGWLTR